jgi:lipopolysaccharide/colanic/teichoic acid biosynthesis glycosyltransferase
VSATLQVHQGRSVRKRSVTPARYHQRKVVADRTIGLLLLIVSLPVTAVLLLLVRATTTGPGIYRQRRVGRNGAEFWLYKIRTMYADAEAVGGPQWATPNDCRITPVGRALRFLHLDELPQLLNVVRGEMSLIGPRPERPEFVARLTQLVTGYEERLKVLPGITGLAQINLPADDSLTSVRNKVVIDCEYIEKGSTYLDLRILACTALRMLGIRHGRAPRWLGVEYQFPETTQTLSDTAVMSLDDTVTDAPAFLRGEWQDLSAASGAESADREPSEQPAFEYSTVGAVNGSFAGKKSRQPAPRLPR